MSLRPVREKDKETRRLLFRREGLGGLGTPEAEREKIILALNKALAKKNLPTFIRVVDAGYTNGSSVRPLGNRLTGSHGGATL
jgi:hypothetical protein